MEAVTTATSTAKARHVDIVIVSVIRQQATLLYSFKHVFIDASCTHLHTMFLKAMPF